MNSTTVTHCAICGSTDLQSLWFAGYLPLANTLTKIDQRPAEQPFYPAELLQCPQCRLVQIGCQVDPAVLFPCDYAYRSGTTKVLRDNFGQLARECIELGFIKSNCNEFVIDIGSNDGTLLGCFQVQGCTVLGIEPSRAAADAQTRTPPVPTMSAFVTDPQVVVNVNENWGKAKIITACNVFAHIPDIHGALDCVLEMLAPGGVFIVEVQQLAQLEYDTVYHEHLYYYSFVALYELLKRHGMKVIHFKKIGTHGGSMRVYAVRESHPTPAALVGEWAIDCSRLANKITRQKLELQALLAEIKRSGAKIYGIGCPSRAVTLIHVAGLQGVLDCVCEVPGSPKIDHYVPGTTIPIVDEAQLYLDQPRYALLLSWHLAEGLMPKIKEKGFQGQFILPLPNARIVS